jgi:hypothetical protein
MPDWIEKYGCLISHGDKYHSIVADKNMLYKYDEVRGFLEEKGYRIFEATSALDARLIFELNIRPNNKHCILFVPADYRPMPDMLLIARVNQTGLSKVFPNLNSEVIAGLSANALATLSALPLYEELSHTKTLKFIIENLFNLDFETLVNTHSWERLIHALITVYLEREEVNSAIQVFFEGLFFRLFPGGEEKLSPVNLVKMLVEQWSLFVAGENCLIDFSDPVLSGSMVFLFGAQLLSSVKVTADRFILIPKHLQMGVYLDEKEKTDHEMEALCSYLENQTIILEDTPAQWFKLIKLLSLAKLRVSENISILLKNKYSALENKLNDHFQQFIEKVYPSLFSMSGIRSPVVVSRILEHIHASPAKKKALMVIDGLNHWQWQLLADEFEGIGIEVQVNSTLAFIPTITAWSRQSIFRGSLPDLNENNSKEQKYFEQFWYAQNFNSHQVAFRKISVKQPFDWNEVNDDVLIMGLVCNDIDDMLHGTVFSTEHHKMSTQQWAKEFGFAKLVNSLVTRGFQLFITSDHGSVQASGIKSLTVDDKVGAVSRSKRYLNFSNPTLLNRFLELNRELDLGTGKLSVWCRHNKAFIPENQSVITHGGSHLWEVIVPFVTIYGKE